VEEEEADEVGAGADEEDEEDALPLVVDPVVAY
jgi:hypothetical protein